jgi:hypothetical protein
MSLPEVSRGCRFEVVKTSKEWQGWHLRRWAPAEIHRRGLGERVTSSRGPSGAGVEGVVQGVERGTSGDWHLQRSAGLVKRASVGRGLGPGMPGRRRWLVALVVQAPCRRRVARLAWRACAECNGISLGRRGIDGVRRVLSGADNVDKVPPFGRTVWQSVSAISLKRWGNNDIWLNTVSAV